MSGISRLVDSFGVFCLILEILFIEIDRIVLFACCRMNKIVVISANYFNLLETKKDVKKIHGNRNFQ